MSGGGPFYRNVKARLARVLPELSFDAATLATIDLALHQERCAWRADWKARAEEARRQASRPGQVRAVAS